MILKQLYRFLIKTMLCLILFLILGILCKKDIEYKEIIQKNLYQESFSFSTFKSFYNRYLGGIFPIEGLFSVQTVSVFNEKLQYQEAIAYEEGVQLKVGSNYLVPSMSSGVVVYLGEKDKYQNVVMIENEEGIDIWYGNLCNPVVSLYDMVSVGTYLGESCQEYIYLVYSKGAEYLDYQDYLS